MWIEPLSLEERERILSIVTAEQRDFLENKLKRGRATILRNLMLSEKVHAIKATDDIELGDDEKDVVDWEIVDYFDYGSRLGKCACGNSLRYAFTVEHTKTKKRITYSKFHLAEFLNLKVSDIDEIMNELWKFDNELDELLIKIENKDYGYEILDLLSGKIDIPREIKEHIEYQIPLLERQIRRLGSEILRIEREEAREKEKMEFEAFKADEEERVKQRKAYKKAQQILLERLELEQKQN